MTQPPPYGSPPPYQPPAAPQQPDSWGAQQPAAWGQQQPPGQWGPQQPQGQWGQPQPDQWGQQQAPAGQWGQPQPDQWGQQPPPGQWGQQPPAQYPPPRQGTNGFAIASLIFGVLGGVLLSVIFGVVALSQIRRRGQGGKGLAIAGLSLSGVWVVGIAAIVLVAALTSGNDPNDPASLADGDDVKVQQLTTGQCLNGLEESSAIRNLPVVPCTQPHEGEVFAVFELTDGDYPGDAEVARLAEDGCVDRLESSVPKAADDPNLEIYFLHPTRSSWRLGDQGVTCVAMSSTGKVTGSIKD